MTDANGIVDNYGTTEGPFGFGYAVSLDSEKEQCLTTENYQVGNENCTKNPKYCENGLSVSVWERTAFSDEKFGEDFTFEDTERKYIVSTGGDEGHPGVAIYHIGHDLAAVVSTGDKVWKVKVSGQPFPGRWNNIALKWEAPATGAVNPMGLELWVNLERVAYSVHGVPATAMAALDPAEMMIGCHKTSTDPTCRNYNDADYDEAAMWQRKLPDNETSFFYGGYREDFSDVSPEEIKEMLKNVDLKDPAQQASAVELVDKLTAQEPEPSVPPTPTASSASSSSAAQSTASSPTAATATAQPPDEIAVAKQQTLMELCEILTDESTIPKKLNREDFVGMMGTIKPVSNILTPSTFSKWKEIQKDRAGSEKVLDNLENWVMGVSKAVTFRNGSRPFKTTKVTDTILCETVKMDAGELANSRDFFEFPNYKTLPGIRNSWNLPYDRVVVPTKLYSDPRCYSRPSNIVSMLYDTFDDVARPDVNPENLFPFLEYEVNSRVLSVYVECDPVLDYRRQIDPRAPPCLADTLVLKKNPIKFKLEHTKKDIALRQPLFHTDEPVSQINRRVCAWFNSNISDFGAWDVSGCKVISSTADYTKCACDHFGKYTVLAEHTEPREVPPEELWLTITKYIFYALSFIALLIYIIVIAVSGDLKEQFHLIGLNIALAVFFGSIFMLVSDMDTIREDRHVCTAIGTLIHVCYLGAGAWIFVLGHASFKAITSGVISGRLKPYFFLAWSVPLMSMGLTYLLFLHDLGLDPRCFISWDNTPKWVFFGPQIFFCAVAFVFGTIVMCNMSTPALRKDNLIDDYGSFCYGASFVMIFFAITWTFGLLAYVRFAFREPDFYPIFQIFNACTGIIIFLFIGLGSRRFRMILAGQAKLRRKMLFGNAFGTPAVPVDKQHLGSPADQRSKNSSLPSSGRASPDRPATTGSDFPTRPVSRGAVAGRPGTRPNSGF